MLSLTYEKTPQCPNRTPRGFSLLLHHLGQLADQLLTVLVPQQILDGLFFQAGNLLHSVDGVLHSLTDM